MINFLKNTLTVICSIILTLLAVEIALHFLPVNEGLRTQPVNEQSPISYFAPNRTSTWSRFADFSMTNTVHSNNYGFINDQDYTTNAELPLIAVVGDSYIEAAMVPYPKTLHGRLAHALEDKWRVYSFGSSGAPLSQYLAFAQFAKNEFKPEKLIVLVVGNDYDESLLRYKSSPGFHYFKETPNNKLTLTRIDYEPSTIKGLLRRSKLIMYLATNVQIATILQNFRASPTETGEFVGQTLATKNQTQVDLSKQAVNTFLDLLPEYSGLSPENILIVMDALRPHIYDSDMSAAAQNSYANDMNTYLAEKAHDHGYWVLDVTEPFVQAFQANGNKFEFEQDGHWNATGHKVVATAIQQTGFLK